MSMDLRALTSCVDIVQGQQDYLQECQEQDRSVQENIDFGHRMKLEEVEKGFPDQVSILQKSQQELCASFIEACQEMSEAIEVARQEQKERLRMERELEELKEDYAKLKGMVRLVVTAQNLQSNRFPTEDVEDVFNPQIIEESLLSLDEEIPQENLSPIPVPGLSFHIPQTLVEISPSPSLRAFLSEPIIIASSIPPLESSPQLHRLLVEDSSVGVGATAEEFEEAVGFEAKAIAMVDAWVEAEGKEPLTNDPEATAELIEAWDVVVDTSPVEGDFEERYTGGGFV